LAIGAAPAPRRDQLSASTRSYGTAAGPGGMSASDTEELAKQLLADSALARTVAEHRAAALAALQAEARAAVEADDPLHAAMLYAALVASGEPAARDAALEA